MNYDDLPAKKMIFEFATLVIARGYQNQPFKVLAQSLLLDLSENIWETTKIYCFIIHFRIKTAMNWHIYIYILPIFRHTNPRFLAEHA